MPALVVKVNKQQLSLDHLNHALVLNWFQALCRWTWHGYTTFPLQFNQHFLKTENFCTWARVSRDTDLSHWKWTSAVLVTFCCCDKAPRPMVTYERKFYRGIRVRCGREMWEQEWQGWEAESLPLPRQVWSRESKLEVSGSWELSKATPTPETFFLAGLYMLSLCTSPPKQCYQKGTKLSNTRANGRRFPLQVLRKSCWLVLLLELRWLPVHWGSQSPKRCFLY